MGHLTENLKTCLLVSGTLPNFTRFLKSSSDLDFTNIIHWYDRNLFLLQFQKSRRFNIKDRLIFLENRESEFTPKKFRQVSNYLMKNYSYKFIQKSNSDLIRSVVRSSSLYDQIRLYYDFNKMSEDDILLRQIYVYNISSKIKKKCNITSCHLFGSSLNGWGTFDSDIDCRFCMPENSEVNLSQIRKYIRLNYKGFEYMQVYPGIVSIIDGYDMLMKLNVDISISHKTQCEMSVALIKLNQIYPFIPMMVCCVKYLYHFIGFLSDKPQSFFSGFKISMIFLFYLQQQNLIAGLNNIELNQQQNQSLSPQDIEEVFQNFFKFVLEMDPCVNIDLGRATIEKNLNPLPYKIMHIFCDYEPYIIKSMSIQEWKKFRVATELILNKLEESSTLAGNCNIHHFSNFFNVQTQNQNYQIL